MSARHPGSQATNQHTANNQITTTFYEGSKISSLQNIAQPQTISLLSKGPNVGVGTTWPMPTPTRVYDPADTITLDLSSTFAHYSNIELTSDDTTINFTNLIQNRATTFYLDITINTATFNSLTFVPALEDPPTLPTTNGSRYILEITAYKTPTEETYFVTGGTLSSGGGGGISFPVIPPVSVRGDVNTNQDIDLSLTTAHSTSMTLTGDIDITFSSFPATANQIEWEVEITQDGAGGHVITWPTEVVNPPTLNTTALSVSVVTFRSNNNGTTIRVGNTVTTTGTGDSSQWSTFPALQLVDMATNGTENQTIVGFVDTGSVVRGSISGDAGAAALRLATASAGKFIISDVITDIASFDNTTGLTIEGSHVINMGNNIINSISELQLSNLNAHTPSNELSIAFDTIDDELKYSVALTTDAHSWYADTDRLGSIVRTGTDTGKLVINAIDTDVLTVASQFLIAPSSGVDPGLNGEFRLNVTDVKVFSGDAVRNLSDIGPQSSIVDGNTSATVLDSAPSFVVVLDGIQKYSISNTRVDYADLDLFGINQINMTDSSSNDISTLTASASGLLLNIINSADVYDLQIAFVDAFHVDTLRTRILSTSPTTTPPELSLFRDDASPINNDILGLIKFDGRDSGGNFTTYGELRTTIESITDGSETANFIVNLKQDGFDVDMLRIVNGVMILRTFNSVGGEGALFTLLKEDATPTAGDLVGEINWNVLDSPTELTYARIQTLISDATDAGLWKVQVRSDNTLSDALIIEGNDNSTQFQFLMSSNGNTRMQPLSSAVMGYFVTSQVTDFSSNIGSSGTLEIPTISDGSPSVNDLNAAFGSFDGAMGIDLAQSPNPRLYVRRSASEWEFWNGNGSIT